MKIYKQYRKQSGFFDFGIGLALLAIFGTTAIVIDDNRTTDNQNQTSFHKDVSESKYCLRTGGSYLLTLSPRHAICCYKTKCLHIDSQRGVSEIILGYQTTLVTTDSINSDFPRP